VLRSGWVSPHPVFWIFMEQGKIMEAEVPTVRVGTTPTGLTAPPPPQHLKVLLQAGYPSCRPTNSVKALKAENQTNKPKNLPQKQNTFTNNTHCILEAKQIA